MRPDIGDLLRGLKKTLGEVIVPSLKEPFAVEQATFMMLLLEHVIARWDKAPGFLRVENAELRQLLADASATLRSSSRARPGLAELLRDIDTRLQEERTAVHEQRAPDAAREANAALRVLLDRVLEHVAGADAAADPTPASAVVQAARTHMKRQLAREREWVSVGEFVW